MRVFKDDVKLCVAMAYKRKRSSYNTRYKRSRLAQSGTTYGQLYKASKRLRTSGPSRAGVASVASRVNNLYRMIETKESTQTVSSNTSLNHNVITYLTNPFTLNQGSTDPMSGTGTRVGDKISVKGVMLKGMVECAMNRPKVFVRIMLVKYAKADDPTTATLFKGDSGNKMIDQINTDRYTILAQKTFNVETSNAPTAVTVNVDGSVATGNPGGIGTKTFKLWVPGTKFGRGGNVQFEDASTSQPKFFSYRWIVLVYDWYGTPESTTTVAKMNSAYSKLYFKDA